MAREIADQNATALFYCSGTYAVASGAAQWIGLVQNHEPDETLNSTSVRYTGGGNRNTQQWVDGGRAVEGTITYHPQDWKLLGFALGSIVDSGSPSPFQHDLAELDSDGSYAFTSGTFNEFANFNIEDSHKVPGTGLNNIRTIRGCIVNDWSMSWDQGGIIEAEAGYMAQDVVFSSGAPSALTPVTTRPYVWRDVKVFLPSGTLIQSLSTGTFSIANNLNGDTYYNNGSDVRQPMIPENRDYTLELTKHADSTWSKPLYEQYFKGGSEFNVLLEVTEAAAGAGSRDMFITLSGCRVDPMAGPSPMEGTNEQTLTIKPKTASVIVHDLIELYNPY